MGKEFSITPRTVPLVETRYRRIVTPIPHPDSVPTLEKLRHFEPQLRVDVFGIGIRAREHVDQCAILVAQFQGRAYRPIDAVGDRRHADEVEQGQPAQRDVRAVRFGEEAEGEEARLRPDERSEAFRDAGQIPLLAVFADRARDELGPSAAAAHGGDAATFDCGCVLRNFAMVLRVGVLDAAESGAPPT